jgi:predicted metal-dependent phosphoesterase TrpH
MGWVDLHLHTTASDGQMKPAEVVHYAASKGLQAIAVTDHDTIDGLDEALQTGFRIGVEVIPGVEISAEFSPGSMHLLGYCFDVGHPLLLERLAHLQTARAERNPQMIEKLNRLGVKVSYEEVLRASGGGQVGRPHFAHVLLEKGYVRTFQEAFDRFLKKGAAAYVDKFRFSPEEALHFIREAGGVPVLAHPKTLGLNGHGPFEEVLRSLVRQGLRGLEVFYPEHSPSDVIEYRAVAQRHGLLMTGGTDYHGIDKSDLDIGVGRGDMRLPYALVETLRTACSRSR